MTASQAAEETTGPAEPVATVVSKLHIGDCFDDPAAVGDLDEPIQSGTVQSIACSEPHQLEIYEIVNMLGDEWPGAAAINRKTQECFPAFADFVGLPYARSELDVIYYSPTERSWRLLGDHSVTCAVLDPAGQTSGTLGASRR